MAIQPKERELTYDTVDDVPIEFGPCFRSKKRWCRPCAWEFDGNLFEITVNGKELTDVSAARLDIYLRPRMREIMARAASKARKEVL